MFQCFVDQILTAPQFLAEVSASKTKMVTVLVWEWPLNAGVQRKSFVLLKTNATNQVRKTVNITAHISIISSQLKTFMKIFVNLTKWFS